MTFLEKLGIGVIIGLILSFKQIKKILNNNKKGN